MPQHDGTSGAAGAAGHGTVIMADAQASGYASFTRIASFAAVYCVLGWISLSTAFVQSNAATVWLPSAFAITLVLSRGRQFWLSIAIGSFALNLSANLAAGVVPSPVAAAAIAFGVALGNTAEALLGAKLAERFAGGRAFLSDPAMVVLFAAVVAPLAAVPSVTIGMFVSWLGGISSSGTFLEAGLTWYVANVAGTVMFAGPAMMLLSGIAAWPEVRRLREGLILLLLVAFVSQAMSDIYFADVLRGWPRPYMIIPLLLWASFRFGMQGAFLSIALVISIATLGTFRGFQAFDAVTPSRSLMYLQIFLALLSLMALSVAAALAQVTRLQQTLEARVRDRTRYVERLLREKEVFTTVVAHDLQSPIYGVRNALKATAEAIGKRRIGLKEVAAAMVVMEETCSVLAERVAGLLSPEHAEAKSTSSVERMRVVNIVANIAAAHRLSIDRKAVSLICSGDKAAVVCKPVEVEHILDILIDNAIRYSPPRSTIEVAVTVLDTETEVVVSDNGSGLPLDAVATLFEPQVSEPRVGGPPRSGLGLHLARTMAIDLGGDITFTPNEPSGAAFRLTLPTVRTSMQDLHAE